MAQAHSLIVRKPYKSRAARRSVAREDSVCASIRDVVANSKADETEGRLQDSVFGSETYSRLPKFRQAYVAGYAAGVRDALAISRGELQEAPAPAPHVRVPRWVDRLQPGATWRRHPLGGGWVSSTAYVESTAYVGPAVVVFDRARVLEQARLQGEGTRVFGDAEVWGSATVFGGALVHGEAQLTERCKVSGVEIEQGRVDGTTTLTRQRDLRILTTRHADDRAQTVLPPPPAAPPGWLWAGKAN